MTDKKKPLTTKQVDELQTQLADLTGALQHERADAMNLRRRHDEQMAGLKDAVKASVVRQLLPVIDNFERALKHMPGQQGQTAADKSQDIQTMVDWIAGVQKIVSQFEKTLNDLGVQRIKTVGEPFDPRWHEAVAMEDGDGAQEIVSEELQSGYLLGGEVIRHAMVKVKMA